MGFNEIVKRYLEDSTLMHFLALIIPELANDGRTVELTTINNRPVLKVLPPNETDVLRVPDSTRTKGQT